MPADNTAGQAYSICVYTCSKWCDPVQAADIIVVSDIGETWSPDTAPESSAPSVGSNKGTNSIVAGVFA